MPRFMPSAAWMFFAGSAAKATGEPKVKSKKPAAAAGTSESKVKASSAPAPKIPRAKNAYLLFADAKREEVKGGSRHGLGLWQGGYDFVLMLTYPY